MGSNHQPTGWSAAQRALVRTHYKEFCAVPLDRNFEYREIKDVVNLSLLCRAAQCGLVESVGRCGDWYHRRALVWRATHSFKKLMSVLSQTRGDNNVSAHD